MLSHQRMIGGLALAATLCACAETRLPARTATAEEVPVRFAHGGLGPAQASYGAARESRTGFTVRRALYDGENEFAIFDLMEVLGDTYLRAPGPGIFSERFAKAGARVERGATGTVAGVRQTAWRGFHMSSKDGEAACVELQRSLREHVEGGIGYYSQALVVGVYCRAGSGQIGAEEAGEIAAGLST